MTPVRLTPPAEPLKPAVFPFPRRPMPSAGLPARNRHRADCRECNVRCLFAGDDHGRRCTAREYAFQGVGFAPVYGEVVFEPNRDGAGGEPALVHWRQPLRCVVCALADSLQRFTSGLASVRLSRSAAHRPPSWASETATMCSISVSRVLRKNRPV